MTAVLRPTAPPAGLRPALLGLAASGSLLTALAIVLVARSDHIDDIVASTIVVAAVMVGYIGTGLFAWWRRPASRTGALMTAVGFTYFSVSLTAVDSSFLFTLGMVLSGMFLVVGLHLVLAFPTGRLGSRGLRRLVGAAYVGLLLCQLAWLLVTPDACPGCSGPIPGNAIDIADVSWLSDLLRVLGSAFGVGIVAAAANVLLRRWRRASRPARRSLGPVLFTGLLLLTAVGATLAVQAVDVQARALDVVGIVAFVAFAALPYAFLAGLLRSRWARAGAVSELVERLGMTSSSLRETLADALGDPTLHLAYWLPHAERFVDGDGRPVLLPAETDRHRAATLVERRGDRIGALVHDRTLCDEPELMSATAAAAALAMANERLEAELRARLEELRESRARLISTGLAERQRLERDLHDGAQQRLVALSLQVNLARMKLASEPAVAGAILDRARDELRLALEELRELARGIHPAVLTDRGLDAAIEGLAARFPVPVEVLATPPNRLPAAVEAAAYFVVSESLANMAKHAEASHATIRVSRSKGVAFVEVCDDGRGGALMEAGGGLRGLADRLAGLDGRLEVLSPPGEGTTVRARIPCASS